jgi:hypothetical protein
MGETTKTQTNVVTNSDVKRPFERPEYKLENNIEMYLKEVGLNGFNFIRVTRDRALVAF